MSRIGKNPIPLPKDVSVVLANGVIKVKGPKGELSQEVDSSITIEIGETEIVCTRSSDHKDVRAKHGLYRSLINNMVVGVTTGYTVKQELVGVGYKATNDGNILDLTLGFSHHIYFQVPAELKVKTETEKGKNPIITLEGCDKQLIGQVAAKLRSLRKPEPYKGKGIKFVGEQLRRKAGKTASK